MASVVRTLKKVLIVDEVRMNLKDLLDNPAIGSEIHQEFNRHGFLCSNAENRRQAIIILDLSMPVMNGLDAAPELNKSFRIVLSFFIPFLRIPRFSRRTSKLAV
jgi:FixJ family two-component response regulator